MSQSSVRPAQKPVVELLDSPQYNFLAPIRSGKKKKKKKSGQ